MADRVTSVRLPEELWAAIEGRLRPGQTRNRWIREALEAQLAPVGAVARPAEQEARSVPAPVPDLPVVRRASSFVKDPEALRRQERLNRGRG